MNILRCIHNSLWHQCLYNYSLGCLTSRLLPMLVHVVLSVTATATSLQTPVITPVLKRQPILYCVLTQFIGFITRIYMHIYTYIWEGNPCSPCVKPMLKRFLYIFKNIWHLFWNTMLCFMNYCFCWNLTQVQKPFWPTFFPFIFIFFIFCFLFFSSKNVIFASNFSAEGVKKKSIYAVKKKIY